MENKTVKTTKVLDGIPMLVICIVIVVALTTFSFVNIFGSQQDNVLRYLMQIFAYITLAEMWNLLSGFTGMTSLGNQTFIGLAGYTVAVMTASYKMPLAVGILAALVIAGVAAFLLSLFMFRMTGMYFAIATWVVSEALCTFFQSWSFVKKGNGMTIKAKPYPDMSQIYLMALVLCVIALVVVFILLRTKTGLGLTAMRDDANAAAAVGVNVVRAKRLVYIIVALFTALAGAILCINQRIIYPKDAFNISYTVSIVFITIIGGIGTVSGPIIGAIIYVMLSEVLAKLPAGWPNIVLGAIAIFVILFLPDGIMGTLQKKCHFEIFSQKRFSVTKKELKAMRK